MTFGTIPKYLKTNTRFIYSCEELCNYLGLSVNALADHVPFFLYKK